MANLSKIRQLCDQRNIQQKELAKIAGVTSQAIIDMIARNSTKTDILERIAKALSVPVGYFFDEDEKKPCKSEDSSIYQKLITAQEKIIENQEKEIADLKNQVEVLKNDQNLPSGYSLAAESKAKLR
ncbi:MAG: helix-turn-helix transcriptional regulator [Bacteroidales bacterium]